MGFHSSKLPKALGTYTDRSKAGVLAVEQARTLRARHRFELARSAQLLRSAGQSFETIAAALRRAIVAGDYGAGIAPPSREKVRYLVAKWSGGARSVDDYAEDDTPKRQPATDARLITFVKRRVLLNTARPIRDLERAVAQEAARLTEEDGFTVEPPGYETLKRLVRLEGRVTEIAAAFGRRAAEIQGVPHETLPYDRPHRAWTLDEADAPWFNGAWDPAVREFVSIRPVKILVRDYRSGVFVAEYVNDPTRRQDPETKRMMRGGFDARDVLTALLAAAIPELASPSCREFAGYLPDVLRWDRAKPHESLRPILEDLANDARLHVEGFFAAAREQPDGSVEAGVAERFLAAAEASGAPGAGSPDAVASHVAGDLIEAIAAGLEEAAASPPEDASRDGGAWEDASGAAHREGRAGTWAAQWPVGAISGFTGEVDAADKVTTPWLPGDRAVNRGHIETGIKFVKALCRDFPNHVDAVWPLDRLHELPEAERTRAAGAGDLAVRRLPIRPELLPPLEASRARFTAVIRYYNYAHPVFGETRAVRYQRGFRPGARKGTDLLLALEDHVTRVTKEGIVHEKDGVRTLFTAMAGPVTLNIDTQIVYKVDPLLRGVFARVLGDGAGRRYYYFASQQIAAAAPGRAKLVAHQQGMMARIPSEMAAAARAQAFDAAFGDGAAAADREAAVAMLEKERRDEAEARQKERDKQRAEAEAARGGAGNATGPAGAEPGGVAPAGDGAQVAPSAAAPSPGEGGGSAPLGDTPTGVARRDAAGHADRPTDAAPDPTPPDPVPPWTPRDGDATSNLSRAARLRAAGPPADEARPPTAGRGGRAWLVAELARRAREAQPPAAPPGRRPGDQPSQQPGGEPGDEAGAPPGPAAPPA